MLFIAVDDANGDFPVDGKMEGHLLSLGSFNSCLDVEQGTFDGKYCLVYSLYIPTALNLSKSQQESSLDILNPAKIIGLHVRDKFHIIDELLYLLMFKPTLTGVFSGVGLCLPNSCQDEDVQRGLNLYTLQTNYAFKIAQCTSKDRVDIKAADIAYM